MSSNSWSLQSNFEGKIRPRSEDKRGSSWYLPHSPWMSHGGRHLFDPWLATVSACDCDQFGQRLGRDLPRDEYVSPLMIDLAEELTLKMRQETELP